MESTSQLVEAALFGSKTEGKEEVCFLSPPQFLCLSLYLNSFFQDPTEIPV